MSNLFENYSYRSTIASSKLCTSLAYCILFLTIPSVILWSTIPITGTFIWWALYAAIIILFLINKKYSYDVANNPNIKFVSIFLLWNIICIIRGFSIAENYWEWKNLVNNSFVLLLPLSVFAFTNQILVQIILRTWFKFGLPAYIFIFPFFTEGYAWGRYLVPVSLVLLFIPLITNKWKIIILTFSMVVILGALDARSNVIKFSVALMCGLLFYCKSIISVRFFRLLRSVFLILPLVLFFLGISGKFNVFKIDEYIEKDISTNVDKTGINEQEDLKADTRTTIYEEVLGSAIKYNYVLFGRTPARGNESEFYGEFLAITLKTGKMERFTNEVSILNIFTWTGVIGVVFYFLIFFQASFLAIKRSNSIIMRIIGLFVAFRWAYAWVEDYSEFDLSYIMLWILLSMCFSTSFRKMSDDDMKIWIRDSLKINLK